MDIMAVEDEQIFLLIDAASAAVNNVTISPGGLTRIALTHAFREVEKHDLVVTKIVMNAQAFADIRSFGQNEFDPVKIV